MKLVERHIIKESSSFFEELKDITHKSKNIYNCANYIIRQEYAKNKKYINYNSLYSLIKDSDDYKSLPRKVSQQTLKLLDQNWKSFFALLKSKNMKSKKKRIPKYLKKDGYYTTIYINQAISKIELLKGFIKLSGTSIRIKSKVFNIQQVRIIPKGNYFIIEVVYDYKEKELKQNNNRYLSIDLGLNNLATIGSNVLQPIIINGKPLKSINQFYNKEKARLQSLLEKNKFYSKKLDKLTLKRNNKINDYLHKSSRYIINHAVSNNINTIVVGYNDEWKQEINIGKVNNQNFVQIPYKKLIDQIIYKAQKEGINVILTEESYTSKCSFLDNEAIEKHDVYLGKRIKRGLFKSSLGKLINADLNGALNILKKVVGEFKYPIEVCSTPQMVTF